MGEKTIKYNAGFKLNMRQNKQGKFSKKIRINLLLKGLYNKELDNCRKICLRLNSISGQKIIIYCPLKDDP